METTRRLVDKSLGWALVFLMGAAVLNVLWQVFTRYVLASPSSFTEELARFLLIWIAFLGATLGVGKRLHLAIDLLPSSLEGRSRHLTAVAIDGCVLCFAFFVLVLGGAHLVRLQWMLGQTSAALDLPMGYVYGVVPFSGVLISVYALGFIRDGLAEIQRQSPGSGT